MSGVCLQPRPNVVVVADGLNQEGTANEREADAQGQPDAHFKNAFPQLPDTQATMDMGLSE